MRSVTPGSAIAKKPYPAASIRILPGNTPSVRFSPEPAILAPGARRRPRSGSYCGLDGLFTVTNGRLLRTSVGARFTPTSVGAIAAMETKDRSALDDARRLLAQCSLFGGLTPDERNVLVGRAHLRRFASGETIFLMDSAGDAMMAILEGHVRISVPSADGKEVVLAILHPGEIFGEIALLDGKGRTADARAMSRCNIAVL